MGSRELSEWMAYDRLYGLPDGYFVAGLVASTLVNLLADRKVTPADLIPFFATEKRAPTPAELKARFLSATATAR